MLMTKSQTIPNEDIKVLYDDPEELRILAFEIPIYTMKFSNMENCWYEMRLGMSYLGKGRINGGFYHKTSFKSMNLGRFDDLSKVDVYPVEPRRFSNEYEGYLNIFLHEDLDEKKVGVIVNQKKNVLSYAEVDAHTLQKIGLSVGVIGGNLKYDLDKMNLNLVSFDQPTTTINESFFRQFTIQNYFILKAGGVFNRLIDLDIHTSQYGKKNGSSSWLLSANLLFALKNNFQDVYVNNNSSNNPTRYIIDNSLMKKNPIGFELGAKYAIKGNAASIDARYRYHPGFSKMFSSMLLVTVSYQIDFFHLKDWQSPF
jgi:hypothetical protein